MLRDILAASRRLLPVLIRHGSQELPAKHGGLKARGQVDARPLGQLVEALSVTPFAPRALDRGLAGVLVSLLRLTDGRLNPNSGAQEMDPSSDQVAHLVQRVVERARAVTGRDEVASLVQAMAHSRLGSWRRRIEKLTGGTRLGYKSRPDGQTLNLLEPAGEGPWTEMTVLHSLREVEPAVNLVLAGEMDDDPRVPGDVEGA